MSSYPLHEAAAANDTDTLNRLLSEKTARVEDRDENGTTPLMRAAVKGNLEAVQHLLKWGADVNGYNPTTGNTALVSAARSGNPDVVRTLLSKGARVDAEILVTPAVPNEQTRAEMRKFLEESLARIPGYKTITDEDRKEADEILNSEKDYAPKMERIAPKLLMRSVVSGNLETVRLLLDAGVSPNEVGTGTTPISMAIFKNNLDIVRLLLERGASPDGPEGRSDSNLLGAVMHNNLEAARLLLEHGATIETEGMTPMAMATATNKTEMMKLLLEFGASPGKGEKEIPLSLYAFSKPEALQVLQEAQGTRWHEAVKAGDFESVRKSLDEGASIDVREDSGETALILAVRRKEGDAGILKLLLDRGANPGAADKNGQTALHWASMRGNVEQVRLLLEHGAAPAPVNQWGRTPLLQAAVGAHREIFTMLENAGATVGIVEAARIGDDERVYRFLTNGTPVDTRNEAGMTALMGAATRHDIALMTDLLDRGADVNATCGMGGVTSDSVLSCATGNISDNLLPALELLVARGANVNLTIKQERPAKAGETIEENVAMARAIARTSPAALRFLLAHGVSPNVGVSRLHRPTAIEQAILYDLFNGEAEGYPLIETLLEYGVDVQVRNEEGNGLIEQALWGWEVAKNLEKARPERLLGILNLLKSLGVTVERNSTPSSSGHALDMAVKSGIVEVVDFVLEMGADPNQPFHFDNPLATAMKLGHTEIADLLRAKGAVEPERAAEHPGLRGLPQGLQKLFESLRQAGTVGSKAATKPDQN